MFVSNPTSNVEQNVVTPAPAIKAERGGIEPKSAKICPFCRHVFCQLALFCLPSRRLCERTQGFADDSQFRQHSRYCNQPHTWARSGSFLPFLVPLPILFNRLERFNSKVLETRATIGQ